MGITYFDMSNIIFYLIDRVTVNGISDGSKTRHLVYFYCNEWATEYNVLLVKRRMIAVEEPAFYNNLSTKCCLLKPLHTV